MKSGHKGVGLKFLASSVFITSINNPARLTQLGIVIERKKFSNADITQARRRFNEVMRFIAICPFRIKIAKQKVSTSKYAKTQIHIHNFLKV